MIDFGDRYDRSTRKESDASHLARLKEMLPGAQSSLDYAKILGDAWLIRTRTENLKYITEKIEGYERN